jgi:phage tail sheath protein FI
VYVEEIPTPPRPIDGVGTSTVGRVSEQPEKPEKSAVLPADD